MKNSETTDNYSGVIAAIDARTRVAVCKDNIQWIIQRRKNGGAARPWYGRHYCRTKKALLRLCAEENLAVSRANADILAALPRMAGGAS